MAFMQGQGINTIACHAWPSRSPDLTPTKNTLDGFGRRLRQRQNQLQNVKQLGQALQHGWKEIPRHHVR